MADHWMTACALAPNGYLVACRCGWTTNWWSTQEPRHWQQMAEAAFVRHCQGDEAQP